MSMILGVQTTFPPYSYRQSESIEHLKRIWPHRAEVLERLASSTGVEHRRMVFPMERYAQLGGLEERNHNFIECMTSLLEEALRKLQERLGFDWQDISVITSTTITGLANPSLEARLMNRLPLPLNISRTPIYGLGCLGGVAAMNRTHDFLRSRPGGLGVVLAAEACSLTFQYSDDSMANLVASGLFADGAGAVVLAGEDHPLARNARVELIDYASSFYPETERIMGWDMVDSGFKIVLSGSVPELVEEKLGEDVARLLRRNRLPSTDQLVSHPGGPKVLRAMARALKKDDSLLRHSWESLRDHGNLSSVSVLNVLERTLAEECLKHGHALTLALGPGFNSEAGLLRIH